MSEDENLLDEGKCYLARQTVPGAIICCRHDIDPDCECVKRFDVDKNCPLTERQAKVTAAALELSRMKRLNIQDDQQYDLLNQIEQYKENGENIHIDNYESTYASLLPKQIPRNVVPYSPFPSPAKDIVRKESNPHIPPQKRNQFNIILIVLILLIVLTAIVVLCFWIMYAQTNGIHCRLVCGRNPFNSY
jgi:hypothetical protein